MGFDEGDLLVGQAIFAVKLLVDGGDGLRSVDVGGRGEVLEGDHLPNTWRTVLGNFFDTKQCPEELTFHISCKVFRFNLGLELSCT